ncbi:MAG TPA: cytochrome P450 [Candidatus Xenobia bacterium]
MNSLPGQSGLPLVGETLIFLHNNFRFLEERVKSFGPVFKTSLLGRPVAVLSGPDACNVFLDEATITRENSMPPHIGQLFGGTALPLLGWEAHRTRKHLVLQAFTAEALQSYLPTIEAVLGRTLASAPEVRVGVELKRAVVEIICTNMMGMAAGPDMDALIADYDQVLAAFSALPINLPGLPLNRALKARDRIFERHGRAIAEHQKNPSPDGLSRMLAATFEGQRLSPAEVRVELHHVVLAGNIVYCHLAGAVVELAKRPDLVERLKGESSPLLQQVVMEVKRHTPVVPMTFGIARQAFTYGGYTIPAGWMVMLSLATLNRDPSIYTEPDGFDPDRFSPGRAEHHRHPHAFVPQGHGPDTAYRCAGYDYSTRIVEIFLTLLLRDYTWELPAQDTGYDWSVMPPVVRDGVRIRLTRRG